MDSGKKTVEKKEIVTTVAYLLGQKDEVFQEYYSECEDILEKLRVSDAANKIRFLCRLRTALLLNYLKTEQAIMSLTGIEQMEWFDASEIRKLRSMGADPVLYNAKANQYAEHFNKLIAEGIDACKPFFPDWVNFDFIRDLFVVPHYNRADVLKEEFSKYQANRQLYPFQFYIHWEPTDAGNILINDLKFLKVVYAQHDAVFTDISKTHDAEDNTKLTIYDFINDAETVLFSVDCENCDPYKLYGVLCNLDQEQLSKVNRIVLYDDVHTSRAWDYIPLLTKLKVEHIEVERVANNKSLVDIRMTAGVCKSFYEEHVDSFILCSSDSDFWGLISSLPHAGFLVMYEYEKCGQAIKDALNTRHIFHCAMDDFYSGNAGELKRIVLKKELEERLLDVPGHDAWELTKEIFAKARITAKDNEMQVFYDKYIKTLKLKIDERGRFVIAMED
ncbi:MAG: NYN domain-containing protein [Lachnospiraceae bacterium]|nr:NYN domain-containing protein [Lachnospiraceae bacterium]